MFEFFGTIAEALSGYIAGRYGASKRSSFHLSAVILALGCGLIFFSRSVAKSKSFFCCARAFSSADGAFAFLCDT